MNEALLHNAYGLHRAGDLNEAAKAYGEVLREDPYAFDALCMLGILHGQRGEFAEAARLADAAAALPSRSSRSLFQLGTLLQNLGRHDEAIARFDQALALQPAYAAALTQRGASLDALGRYADAHASFEAALTLSPNLAEALFRLCGAELRLGRHREAAVAIERYLQRFPNNAEAWISRGSAYVGLEEPGTAAECFARALGLAPEHAVARSSYAGTLKMLNRFEEAIAQYRTLLQSDPDHPYALGNNLDCRQQICDWRHGGDEAARAREALRAGHQAMAPFLSLSVCPDAADQHYCAQLWTAREFPAHPTPLWKGERYGHERIRVAYLGADFREHATAYLMAGLFESHDRERFDIFGVSYGPDDGSPMRNRLEAAFETFLDVRALSDVEIAAELRRREIDIAIDLKGHTFNGRPGILRFRPAPVQAHYLGYPGTMGADYVDYLIADRIVAPPEQQSHYSEKLVYLPGSYQANDDKRVIGERSSRTAEGLPETGFVFCSFGGAYKLTPEMFAVWMRLLQATPDSVLWLLEPLLLVQKQGLVLSASNPPARRRLQEEAARHGVAPERLVFAAFEASQERHLGRLSLADLFLDTLPVNAHTSASDALWAGVPVLTCAGASFAGRVGASLLDAVGLPELVTETLDRYEARARELAKDPPALAAIRARLAANRATARLFDSKRFARGFETALVAMWERAERGQAPAALDLDATGSAP
jgi:protein O-GlcNAc transferase